MKKSGNINRMPEQMGRCEISTITYHEEMTAVDICADPDGFRYLASLFTWMADIDLGKVDIPLGAREHIHLHANDQLSSGSCEVTITRADAKGSGQLPDSNL